MVLSRGVGLLLVLLAGVIGLGMANVLRYEQERQPNNTSASAPYKLSFAPYTDAFALFKEKYARTYTDQEEIRRFNIFVDNVKLMENHNWRYHLGETTFYMAINHFSDLTLEEYMERNKLGKFSTRRKHKIGDLSWCDPIAPTEQPPSSIDWVKLGAVTGVKDQGQCGSCWTFSTTGSVEGHNFIKSKKLISLSEQQIVDCCTLDDCSGCAGGLMDQAFYYIHQAGGLETEGEYSYIAQNGVCHFRPDDVKVTVNRCFDLPQGNEDTLKIAAGVHGPVAVAIDASHSSFQSYGGGVYYCPECDPTQLDHGVLVAGYGSFPVSEGGDYWLVKNSWGEGWGINGYIYMARNMDNNCGIATMASYPNTTLV